MNDLDVEDQANDSDMYSDSDMHSDYDMYSNMLAEREAEQDFGQDIDNIIAPRKTKNSGRFLGGIFSSILDIIKNLFGGDTDAFLRAKRAGKI